VLTCINYRLFSNHTGVAAHSEVDSCITFFEGIKINPENVETINKWTVPKTKKDVEFFLGFMNYQRAHSRIFWFSIATS
jgi:hypothetical protein